MSPGLRIVAVACGIALVAGGCGGGSSLNYRGSVNGVSIALRPSREEVGPGGTQPRLAVRFTAAAGSVWRHVVHVRKREAFCMWPEKNGSEMVTTDVEVRSSTVL